MLLGHATAQKINFEVEQYSLLPEHQNLLQKLYQLYWVTLN